MRAVFPDPTGLDEETEEESERSALDASLAEGRDLRRDLPSDTDGETSLLPVSTTVVRQVSLSELSSMLQMLVGMSVLKEKERGGRERTNEVNFRGSRTGRVQIERIEKQLMSIG